MHHRLTPSLTLASYCVPPHSVLGPQSAVIFIPAIPVDLRARYPPRFRHLPSHPYLGQPLAFKFTAPPPRLHTAHHGRRPGSPCFSPASLSHTHGNIILSRRGATPLPRGGMGGTRWMTIYARGKLPIVFSLPALSRAAKPLSKWEKGSPPHACKRAGGAARTGGACCCHGGHSSPSSLLLSPPAPQHQSFRVGLPFTGGPHSKKKRARAEREGGSGVRGQARAPATAPALHHLLLLAPPACPSPRHWRTRTHTHTSPTLGIQDSISLHNHTSTLL